MFWKRRLPFSLFLSKTLQKTVTIVLIKACRTTWKKILGWIEFTVYQIFKGHPKSAGFVYMASALSWTPKTPILLTSSRFPFAQSVKLNLSSYRSSSLLALMGLPTPKARWSLPWKWDRQRRKMISTALFKHRKTRCDLFNTVAEMGFRVRSEEKTTF